MFNFPNFTRNKMYSTLYLISLESFCKRLLDLDRAKYDCVNGQWKVTWAGRYG